MSNVAQEIEVEAKSQIEYYAQSTGDDDDEFSSECQEIEQEHQSAEWFKPCCACCMFCAHLLLSGLLLVQDISIYMMKDI